MKVKTRNLFHYSYLLQIYNGNATASASHPIRKWQNLLGTVGNHLTEKENQQCMSNNISINFMHPPNTKARQ